MNCSPQSPGLIKPQDFWSLPLVRYDQYIKWIIYVFSIIHWEGVVHPKVKYDIFYFCFYSLYSYSGEDVNSSSSVFGSICRMISNHMSSFIGLWVILMVLFLVRRPRFDRRRSSVHYRTTRRYFRHTVSSNYVYSTENVLVTCRQRQRSRNLWHILKERWTDHHGHDIDEQSYAGTTSVGMDSLERQSRRQRNSKLTWNGMC